MKQSPYFVKGSFGLSFTQPTTGPVSLSFALMQLNVCVFLSKKDRVENCLPVECGHMKGRRREGALLRICALLFVSHRLGLLAWVVLGEGKVVELTPGHQQLSVCRLCQCLLNGCEVGENSSVYPGKPVPAVITAGWTGTRGNLTCPARTASLNQK